MAVYFPDTNYMYIHFPKTGGCMVYDVLGNLNVNHEYIGFQHDPIDHLGKYWFTDKPKILIFSREKESWIESYWRWRDRNKTDEYRLPGDSENWHPFWVLEDLFDRDYTTFRENLETVYPNYYENLCKIYYAHPTFEMQIYPYEDFVNSLNDMFKKIGYQKDKAFFENYPKINATI